MSTLAADYFDLDDLGGVAIVRVMATAIRHPEHAQEFSAELASLVEKEGRTRLVLDMRECDYLGSTAFAAILGLYKKVNAAGGKLAIFGFRPDVLVGANIIGMGHIIPIVDDENQAIAAV